jgi:anti-sigma B factor antagonist
MSNSRATSVGVPGSIASLEVVQAGPRRLCLAGELDMAGVPDVRARLVGMAGDVELDCSGLTFIDASGLSVLVAAHRCCEARGAKLTIVDPSRCVVRLLALTGLDSVLGGRAESSAP